MAEKKFSQLTAKGATIADTDLVAISESAGGGTYTTKSVTGANIKGLVTDANLTTTDITTNDVSTAKHGFAPKAPNDATKYLDGTGAWSTPAGGGGGLTVGTTAVTSGTVGRIFFQGSGDVVQQDSTLFWDNTNKCLGVGATPSTSVRLDVRAQGALSTDIAFRVRNSADTQNLASIAGNGDIAIGLNATGVNGGAGFEFIAIGSSAKSCQYGVSIGPSAGKNQNSSAQANVFIGAPAGGGASTISGTMNIGIGMYSLANLTSGQENIAIGGSIYGSGAGSGITSGSQNVLIGRSAGYQVSTGSLNTAVGYFAGQGITTGAQNTHIGSNVSADANYSRTTAIGSQLQAKHNGSIMIGNAVNTSGFCSSLTSDALHVFFGVGDNNQSFYVNNNTNVVLKSHVALTSGTHFEAAATNTFTIHNGTAPVANIADAYAQYSADITAGNAAPHFRTENGAVIKVYQETTGVAAATLVGGGGTALTDTDTFDGYTLKQIVKALRNQGLLA